MEEKENNTNKDQNTESKESENNNEEEVHFNEENENEESKSTILAPYNSFISNSDNNEEGEEDGKELDILNEACDFNNLAQKANVDYEKKIIHL